VNIVVVGGGDAGIENALFYADNSRMLYGDASGAIAKLIAGMKELDGGH
jgi:NAD(P) transhydrogenase subunit beta